MIALREEEAADRATVRTVNELAFGGPTEADLIDALRRADAVTLSLVAEDDGVVVGHALFSPVRIHATAFRGGAVALGPMAVLPERQRSGIGSALVRRGLELCGERGERVAVVLGHPEYYPRFGFRPARLFGLRSEYAEAGDAFMAIELLAGALAGIRGLVTYHAVFADF